jgi:hypothetical protein
MEIQKELIEKYVLLLMEYIHLVNTSEIIKQLDNANAVFKIGINALSHIYKITFLITKNVDTAGCYTQKGIYCYLEYIEQMNRTNTLHNLDNMDAVLFVYDKTLSDLYSPNGISTNTAQPQNMFSNILSLNHPQTVENTHTWKIILENLCYITNIILWLDRNELTYLQRIDLTHEQLHKWLVLFLENGKYVGKTTFSETNSPSTLEILKYISTIQEKCDITYVEYIDLLNVFYKLYKKMLKQKKMPTHSIVCDKCITIIVNFSGKPMSEIVDSDYGKTEGWKSIADFAKWLLI